MKSLVRKTSPWSTWGGWRLACCFCLWTSLVQAEEAPADSLLQLQSKAVDAEIAATASDTSARSVDSLPASDEILDAGEATESFFSIMVKLGLALGLVVLLAWGAVWLLRRSALGQQLGATGQVVEVVERTFLGPKKAIYLVDIGGRVLALGVTEENISLLSEWPEGELELKPIKSSAPSFATHFKNVLRASGNTGNAREV